MVVPTIAVIVVPLLVILFKLLLCEISPEYLENYCGNITNTCYDLSIK